MMENDQALKNQLVKHLNGGAAFAPVDRWLKAIEFKNIGLRPAGFPYSFYEVFMHMVLTQKDILEYIQSKEYQTKNWPQDYWPDYQRPDNEAEWEKLKKEYMEDREKLVQLVLATDRNLTDPIPSHPEHTLFRELMLVVEHSAYHTGQLVLILRVLGIFPQD